MAFIPIFHHLSLSSTVRSSTVDTQLSGTGSIAAAGRPLSFSPPKKKLPISPSISEEGSSKVSKIQIDEIRHEKITETAVEYCAPEIRLEISAMVALIGSDEGDEWKCLLWLPNLEA
nr:hypothetical protein Iba_chr06eCG5450 [Ipomoea batatas]